LKKRLLTFLGTGNYQPSVYCFEGQEKETSFVQVALCQFLQPEEMVVFVTSEAKSKKWQSLKQAVNEEFSGLDIKTVEIPLGGNEDEVWQIFERIVEEVHAGDSLSVDITHSFRSLPIIALACAQYLRTLKNIALKGIYYGAWEAKEEREGRQYSPVFDLAPFVELMDWSEAVETFDRSGDMSKLNSLFNAEVIPRQKASKGADREARLLRDVGEGLLKVSQRMATCRGKKIYTDPLLGRISKRLDELEHDYDPPKAFKPLLSVIRGKIKEVQIAKSCLSDEVRRGLEAVKWCIQHGLVQQAYTLLQETLITHFCQLTDRDMWESESRQEVSMALGLYHMARNNWKASAKEKTDFVENVWSLAGEELCDLYNKLTARRNDINHAGTVNMASEHRLAKEIKDYLSSAIALLEK